MPAIEVNHLNKSFGQQAVLKDISLTVQRGEIYTLLGENGAGKTTLIRILCTLLAADSGSAKVFDMDVAQQPAKVRERFSLNSQSTSVDEQFTGAANLRLIAQLRQLPNVDQAVKEIAERFAMTDFLQKKVRDYSGGMRRRLDIAMSLLGDPDLVFLDEPTTGVDPKNRLAIWHFIEEIRNHGKTVFLTTQYLDEADRLSDRIGFINDGHIVLSGSPAEIKRHAEKNYRIVVAPAQATAAAQLFQQHQLPVQQVKATFTIPAAQAQAALALLTAAPIVVTEFGEIDQDLEAVFLKVTSKGGQPA